MSYSTLTENSSEGQLHCTPTFISPFSSSANPNNALLNDLNDLPFTRNVDLGKPNFTFKQSNTPLKCNGSFGSSGGTMQTYHIYDDTDRFCLPKHKPEMKSVKKMTSNEAPPTPAHRRRKQFVHSSNSRGSKSFESPLKTPGDPLKDSFEHEEENHLNNVEQVVKLLSEKLSKAAKEKEPLNLQLDTDLTYNSPKTITTTKQNSSKQPKPALHHLSLESQTRRNSLPYRISTLNSQFHKPTEKLSQQCSNTGTTSTLQKSQNSLSINNLDCSANNATLSTISRTKSLLSGIWKNQSLPSSPSHAVTSSKSKLIDETQVNGTANNVNMEKRRSNGRHFFHSPNVIRKMRRK